MAKGSHHLIIYRSKATDEMLSPTPCMPFVETLGGTTIPIMVSEIAEETLTFPEGTGMEFEANQMIRIEAHYINYYTHTITAHADVTFKAHEAGADIQKVDMLFFGHGNINLAPGAEHTSNWHYFDVPNNSKVFAVTGHMHAMGTNVEIKLANGQNDKDGQQIYPGEKPFVWNEAPVEQFNPSLEFPSGQGLSMRCSWKNTTNKTIAFGQSATDEMCFLWAYYYPSKGYRICIGGLINCFDDG
jgi:hypothetical protein